VFLPQLDEVHPARQAGLDERLEVRPVGGAQVQPPIGQAPVIRGRHGMRQPVLAAWAWAALALAFIFCLYWRTLTNDSGESMSATDRNVPVSP
jgi:hypothetical protein